MSKLTNLLRVVAFVVSTLISASVFGGFAVWAVSTLDPSAQEVIGLINSPWVAAPKREREPLSAVNGARASDRNVSAGAARH